MIDEARHRHNYPALCRPKRLRRPTPAVVNRALVKAGFKVEIVRGNGYYWFDDETTSIPSIYANSLLGETVDGIVNHVRRALKRED